MPPEREIFYRREIGFQKFIPPERIGPTPWDWMKSIFDAEFPKTTRWRRVLRSIKYLIIKNRPSESINEKARVLYRYLPSSEGELKQVRKNTMDCLRWEYRGRNATILRPYNEELRALFLAVNVKLANHLTNPNQNNWDERACNLFLEIQTNLSTVRPLYFATMTFPPHALISPSDL